MSKAFWIAIIVSILTPGLMARSQTVSDTRRSAAATDTLRITPAMIDSMRLERPLPAFERKHEYVVLVPKGPWIAGNSFGTSMSDQNDDQRPLVEKITGEP